MKFRYELNVKPITQPINHTHKLFLIGSCFTENIGEKLKHHKFQIFENPNGILFNPVSVAESIINIIHQKEYRKEDLFYYNEAWHSWQHHSRFSGVTPEETLQKINQTIASAHNFLKTADYCIITLGSAWIYTLTELAQNAAVGSVAANNHKAPANWFQKRLMDAAQVITVLGTLLDRLGNFNPNIKVIFTISPVRHLREGMIENNRSKAMLIAAVHHLIDELPQLYYFPAYELVIDDLRDYRYYAEDLVHPNYAATNYVWDKLVDACMTAETKSLMQSIAEIQLAFKHRPFNPESKQHQQFLNQYLNKTLELKHAHPYLNLDDELSYFSKGMP